MSNSKWSLKYYRFSYLIIENLRKWRNGNKKNHFKNTWWKVKLQKKTLDFRGLKFKWEILVWPSNAVTLKHDARNESADSTSQIGRFHAADWSDIHAGPVNVAVYWLVYSNIASIQSQSSSQFAYVSVSARRYRNARAYSSSVTSSPRIGLQTAQLGADNGTAWMFFCFFSPFCIPASYL